MIKSMTGYGCSKGTSDKLEITVEVRSVNNRFLDCSIRLPRIYSAIEDSIKSLVQKNVSRGKVDVFITIDSSKADDVIITVNTAVADSYIAAFKELSDRYGIENDATSIALSKLPDVLAISKTEADMDKLREDILSIAESALDDFNAMRIKEGEKLFSDITSHVEHIANLVDKVEQRSPIVVSEYRRRLTDKMMEILGSTKLDESRILTEAAIFADKTAVDEEIVRLRSHISQLLDLLNACEPVGRKMDFLVQEFNREANTIGSKGSDLEMAKIVVDIKSEIEKIREQIQNVE